MAKPPKRLDKNNTALVVIDIQKLFEPMIHEMDTVIANSSRLIRFSDRLCMPVLMTEHNPQKLGPTVSALSELVPRVEPIEKISFSCAGDHIFMSKLKATHREQVILCGIESHVCVYQTARDLLEDGYQVVVAADAVSSRQVSNRNLGLAYMRDIGVQIMTSEMIFFELLRIAKTDDFNAVADILKENPHPGRKLPEAAVRKAGA